MGAAGASPSFVPVSPHQPMARGRAVPQISPLHKLPLSRRIVPDAMRHELHREGVQRVIVVLLGVCTGVPAAAHPSACKTDP